MVFMAFSLTAQVSRSLLHTQQIWRRLQVQQVSRTTERAWIALLRVGPSVLAAVEAALKAADMPPLAWYDVLWELKREGRPLQQRELGARLLVARYNLSRLLDRLEAEGLIERTDSAEDGRVQVLALTRAGRALRARMWPAYAAAIRAAVEAKLSATEAGTLARLMNKLRS
jgi:DNA-binding MarR family transcriptional regulator